MNTSVPVLEVIEDGDFSRESDGRLLIDNTVFGVEAGAVISFKLAK